MSKNELDLNNMINSSLYHHGVKGQKWGIRKGPPYPIEDKVLKSGTRINSVSLYNNSEKYRKRNAWMYTYNPDDKHDSSIYKGPFAYYKMKTGYNWVYEHQFEVVNDLKMPNKKERIDAFVDTFNSNKKTSIKELTRVQNTLAAYNVGSEASRKVNLKNLKTKEDYKAAYEVFNHAMENANAFKITKSYSKLMSKNFDAMVDDNNQGIYNDAHDPVIIFRANEALKTIGTARMLDVKEITSNYNSVADEMAKQGKNVLL